MESGSNYELFYQLTFSAVISTGVLSFLFQTTLYAQMGVKASQNRIFKSNLRRVWLIWIYFCHCTEKYFWNFVNFINVWWVKNMDGHFSNHFLNWYISVPLPCRVMYKNWMCFFYLIVLLSYSAVNFFYK